MICSNCGRGLPFNAKFCPNCGSPIDNSNENSPQSQIYSLQRERVIFILLAVLLGAFGAHNFYAGFYTKAVVQLIISICSCGILSPIVSIWAIIEGCIVTTDVNGVNMK